MQLLICLTVMLVRTQTVGYKLSSELPRWDHNQGLTDPKRDQD